MAGVRSIAHYNTAMKQDAAATIKEEFARRLSKRMAERGWKQTDLARAASVYLPERAGRKGPLVGRDQISHYTRGVTLPRESVLVAICKALHCEPSDLLPSKTPNVSQPKLHEDFRDTLAMQQVNPTITRIRLDKMLPSTAAIKIAEIVYEAERPVHK